MVATLGSGESGGSIYIMDLSEAIDSAMGSWTTYRVHSLDRTMWTADCSSDGTHAAFGEFIESELKCRRQPKFPLHIDTLFLELVSVLTLCYITLSSWMRSLTILLLNQHS